MVATRAQAVATVNRMTTNPVGMCQAIVTSIFEVAPVGDYDHNGRANAVDGIERDRAAGHYHAGDMNPPAGVPVGWTGRDGHRAISLGRGMIRSSDAGGPGRFATVPLGWVSHNWGLHYDGWSETMNGILIPNPTVAPPKPSIPRSSKNTPAAIDLVAHQVIQGKWGNGPVRIARLKAAGYNVSMVQARVNQLLA
jgi:hypothetical protein